MKKIIFTTTLLLIILNCFSQTSISGMINSDITLRKSDSPYLVTSALVISPKGKITIEPGVEVRFSSGMSLEVRGTLIAAGTLKDSITFTSNTNKAKGSWTGIDIKNTQGGNATFNYCKFLYASTAINEECCWGGKDAVKNSRFTSNLTAIGGYSGNVMPIDSCLFSDNTYCLIQADKTVNHCTFLNNEYGLYQTERISVYNSVFKNNTRAALNGGRGILSGCTIENNNVGVQSFFEGFTIANCIISKNDIGIELGNNNGDFASIDDSRICNNTTYNVKNNSSYNVNLYGNCWCSSDSATVESKIYDGSDNSNLGLISYDIFNDECNSIVRKIDKTVKKSIRWTISQSPYIITTTFIVFPNETLFIEPGVEVRFSNGKSLEVRGTLIASGTLKDSITFTSNTNKAKGSWTGINIKNTQGGNATFKYCKFLYASTAINEECCWGGKDAVKNSRFTSNLTAIGGYSGNIMPIDSCLFTGNTYCLTNADKTVNHCTFLNNTYGLYQTERINVYNSVFKNNTQAAINGGRGILSGCTIENNNVGIQSLFEGLKIMNCTISNNNIGIELGNNNGDFASIDDSRICNNTTYNVKNNGSYNVNLYGNCWCSSDSATVESKIYDGSDNRNLGFISYEIFNEECNSVVRKIDKTVKKSIRWTISQSPYIITSTFIVFPNETLFIEPGVEVRFSNGKSLEVRGTLIASGTLRDSITFTSNTNKAKGSWTGINIRNTLGGNAILNYCKFLYASTAVNEECCWGGKDAIKNSRFTSNLTAIGGYSGNIMPVDSCLFTSNTYCITLADKIVNHCTFLNNTYGLYQTERISVYNSVFKNNTQAALNGSRGILSGCTIENNNIGVQSLFDGFTIKNCTISNNDIGIELGYNYGITASIDSSHICNNTTYNVKNNSSYNATLYGNCWCSSDSAMVESKIFDGWDNSSYGLVDYILYSDNCLMPIFKTTKLKNAVYYYTNFNNLAFTEKSLVYPNPVSDVLYLDNSSNIIEIRLFDNTGRLLIVKNNFDKGKFEIDMSIFKNGLYILKTYSKNRIVNSYKISVIK